MIIISTSPLIIQLEDSDITLDCKFLLLRDLDIEIFKRATTLRKDANTIYYEGVLGKRVYKNRVGPLGIVYTTYDKFKNVPYKVYTLNNFL